MANIAWQDSTAPVELIPSGNTLNNVTRKAVDFDNRAGLDLFGDFFLNVRYASAPSSGTKVAELYILPENGSGTFPAGGDGSTGANTDPQKLLLVGTFESRIPSTTITETLCVPAVTLYPRIQRIVVKNTSGQQFGSQWSLMIKPYKYQN